MIAGLTRATILALVLLFSAPAVLAAHVGSPDVIYEGKAGPYDVRIIVRVPQVVPGLAEVTVRVLRGTAREVRIQPVFWRTGAAGSPSPDQAKLVDGVRGLFSGQLWLMARGAYSVYVTVDGAEGSGTASVPLMSVATGRLGMSAGLGVLLAALGALLVAGLITIAYAAAGDAVVEPGVDLDRTKRRRARLVASIAAPVIALALFGGAKWWRHVDGVYQTRMYRPQPTRASVRLSGAPTLQFVVVDSMRREATLDPLVPDHGKLMHLFVIDSASMTRFAHLHPVFNDTGTFTTPLPPLAPGRYRLFGDITTETGQTRTLSGMVSVTSEDSVRASTTRLGPDDAWTMRAGARRHGATAAIDTLADGVMMEWLADSTPIRPGVDATLRFRVREPDGAIATLEPYLGMVAHAVIARGDGSVFVHLHPEGTVSMAAQNVFALRDRGDTTANGRLRFGPEAMPSMAASGEFAVPYVFPRAGFYHIWVQVRDHGRVLTGAYDLTL